MGGLLARRSGLGDPEFLALEIRTLMRVDLSCKAEIKPTKRVTNRAKSWMLNFLLFVFIIFFTSFPALGVPGLDGPLFVSNRDGTVSKVLPDGTFSTCVSGSELAELDGLAFNSKNEMIISNEGKNEVVKVKGTLIEPTPGCTGTQVTPIGTGLNVPKLLIINDADEVFVGESLSGRVIRIQDGTTTLIFDFRPLPPEFATFTLLRLGGIALDSEGNLYVAVQGQPATIQRFKRNPALLTGFEAPVVFATFSGLSEFIAGVQFAPNGDLYVADLDLPTGTGRLNKIAKGSNTPAIFATGFLFPDGVAIEKDGDIFVAEVVPKGCVKQIKISQVTTIPTTPEVLVCGLPFPDDLAPLFGAGSPNHPPQKPPLPDIGQVQECTSVTIDGSGATDPDGDKLSFKWELIAAPPGVRVPRTLSASPKLTFFPTQPGIYRVRLTVSDGRGGTASQETSFNVIPSLGCDFIPGEKDFELMMNALVHHIYEVIVDTNHARNLLSQNRSEALITDSIDRALDLMGEIPADFAELFGQLDNMDETLTEFLTLVETRAEDADITPLQQALFIKIKNKLEMMQRVLLDMRNELDSLRDTLDSGDPNVADVRQALEQARVAVNDGDLASAMSNLNDAYQRLRIARHEQARILAKEKIVKRRFVEINGILPRAFAVLNDDLKVVPVAQAVQPIRLQTKGSISLWILPQRDGSFTLQAQSANVKTIRLEVYALSGERLVLRSANGNVVTVKTTDEHGQALANGVYLILITVETKAHQIERQVHKITVLQK